jgi:peptidoglycan/xylan/chitin deacetylase (PgdA/CDA1 family)
MSSTASSAKGSAAATQAPRPALIGGLLTLLPAIIFVAYALTTPGLLRGEHAGLYVTAAALVESGGFAIDGQIDALAPSAIGPAGPPASFPHLAYFAGHHYFAQPPGLAALATPLYLLGLVAAPALGPEAPLLAVALLGPLLAALVSLRFLHLTRHYRPLGLLLPIAAAIFGLPLNRTQPLVLLILMIVALIASWAAPLAVRLYRGETSPPLALALGVFFGAPLLLDYGVGVMSGLVLAIFLALLLWRRRDLRRPLLVLAGAAIPLVFLLAWHTALFGAPWRAAFRVAVDPAERALWAIFREGLHLAIAFPVLIVGTVAARRQKPTDWRRGPGELGAFGVGIAIILVSLGLFVAIPLRLARAELLVSIDWQRPATLALLGVIGALFGLLTTLAGHVAWPGWRRAAAPAILAVALLLPPPGPAATAATAPTESYAAPFTTARGQAVWALDRATARETTLQLEAGGSATSPWIEARPGLAYAFGAAGDGPLRVTFLWEDGTRASLGSQSATFGPGAAREARFAAPVGAAGLRLRLEAPGSPATVAGLQLTLRGGTRVEPFPDGNRAALAFSFDWESAMGGLIHSRSVAGAGENAAVGLRADGGPSVAEAEAKGLRMRDGARYLADLFARYGILATFYSTGYNLLEGNPACQKFLGDPIYRNANRSNGWGSDWWRTHPWYENDPCATEAEAPAWYFASETRALAEAGHEIASHTFGHLYVRGVSPAQLREDLELWNSAARALGLPPAGTFAFPWTSSNSLDESFWAVFEQVGMTILTRVYGPDVRHPYELAPVKGAPGLVVFPDFYLASNAEALDEALARIDITLASRGYHSLWNHPNETLEQGGQVVWQRAVDYAAAQRERGLWIAPVSEIANFAAHMRQVTVTSLPLAGRTRLIVENHSGQRLEGVTLGLPHTGTVEINGQRQAATPAQSVILPVLDPGAVVTVEVVR